MDNSLLAVRDINHKYIVVERTNTQMSKTKSTDELHSHKKQALQNVEDYLNKLIASEDSHDNGKADKLCYWLKDWMTFLDFEKSFSPMSLRRYKRGEIVKVHLGFNVGSEEGGLHYAVVLDKNNAKSSPVITIIPLTSVKPHTDVTKLKNGSIFLGNELFAMLKSKISSETKNLKEKIKELQELVNELNDENSDNQMAIIDPKLDIANRDLELLDKMKAEVLKMKCGSIALVNQITTISKIRIYDPKTDYDILSGIRLSNEKLDLIDDEIQKKFTNI